MTSGAIQLRRDRHRAGGAPNQGIVLRESPQLPARLADARHDLPAAAARSSRTAASTSRRSPVPAGRDSRRDRRHHLVRPRRTAPTAPRSTSSRRSPTSARPADEATDPIVSTATFDVVATRRDAGAARTRRPALLRRRDAGAATRSSPSASARSRSNFAAGSQRGSGPRRRRRSASPAPRPALPEDVRAKLTQRAQGGRRQRRDRSVERSRRPRRGRPGHLRASGRLPADPGAAPLQRHALRRYALRALTAAGAAPRLAASSGGSRPRKGRAGECPGLALGRRRSNRPRNLSGTRDRARLTVWKVSPPSGGGRRRGKPARVTRGGQSSQVTATDGGS